MNQLQNNPSKVQKWVLDNKVLRKNSSNQNLDTKSVEKSGGKTKQKLLKSVVWPPLDFDITNDLVITGAAKSPTSQLRKATPTFLRDFSSPRDYADNAFRMPLKKSMRT